MKTHDYFLMIMSRKANFLQDKFKLFVQSNLLIRNGLISNKLVLRNHFQLPIANLLHKGKEHLALRNNNRVTKKFHITSPSPSSTALCMRMLFSGTYTKYSRNLSQTRIYASVYLPTECPWLKKCLE